MTTRAHFRGIPSASEITASTAALALPRSAGALTRTLSVAPTHPARQLREDPGTTLIGSLMVVSLFGGGAAGKRIGRSAPNRLALSRQTRRSR